MKLSFFDSDHIIYHHKFDRISIKHRDYAACMGYLFIVHSGDAMAAVVRYKLRR
jgi:hypothetical protein